MPGAINLYKRPDLKNARLIMAWPDAGHVGLRVVDYLKNKLEAEKLGRIEPYDFSLVPWISVKNGLIESLELMKNEFYYWKDARGERDLVILRSEQPTVRPYEYVSLVLDVACQFGVKRIYMVGSFGATGITHAEEPMVLGVVNQARLRGFLESQHVSLYPEYKGIGNLHSSFLWFARDRDIEAISLWSPMPHYIARLPFPWSNYPKCSLAILGKLATMEGIEADIKELEISARQTDTEMGKIYNELYEQAKKELVYQNVEPLPTYTEDASEPISDEGLRRMMRDIEDFFKRGNQ